MKKEQQRKPILSLLTTAVLIFLLTACNNAADEAADTIVTALSEENTAINPEVISSETEEDYSDFTDDHVVFNRNDSYNRDDVSVINAMIRNNGLRAAEDDPDNWDFVSWDDSIPRRVTGLYLNRHKELSDKLSVDGLEYLTYLNCADTNISELSVSHLINLKELYVDRTNVTALEVSKLTNLARLSCAWTGVTDLDVSNLVNLNVLSCDGCRITHLERLAYLNCSYLKIRELDLSGPAHLTELHCYSPSLAILKLNGRKLKLLQTAGGIIELTGFNAEDKTVELTAYPDFGYTLDTWNGVLADSGTGKHEVRIKMIKDITVSAEFQSSVMENSR